MGGGTGSTIQARQELGQNLFSIILIVVIVILAILCVYLISRAITKYHNSSSYIEKKKKRPTQIKDISAVSAACNLTKEEKDLLARFCHENKTPNILYLAKEKENLDALLKKFYTEFDNSGDEKSKSVIFSLRKKIFSVYNQRIVVKNTKFLGVGTSFTYTKEKGFHYRLILVENGIDGMILDIPSVLNENTDFPKPLEKISLVFEAADGMPYTLESRIVRFQEGKEGKKQVIVIHSDKIAPLQKRAQERIDMNAPCKFNSVKSSTDKKGKSEQIIFTVAEKDYDGTLEDISAGGCKLSTNLPIKAGQYINVKADFNKKQTDSAIGIIVRTTKRSDNIFVLHIRFLQIDLAVVNRINAMVIHYDE